MMALALVPPCLCLVCIVFYAFLIIFAVNMPIIINMSIFIVCLFCQCLIIFFTDVFPSLTFIIVHKFFLRI